MNADKKRHRLHRRGDFVGVRERTDTPRARFGKKERFIKNPPPPGGRGGGGSSAIKSLGEGQSTPSAQKKSTSSSLGRHGDQAPTGD